MRSPKIRRRDTGSAARAYSCGTCQSAASQAASEVTGNTAPTGPEITHNGNYGATLRAANHNLFGVNGTAGALLPDILNLTLALNGGLPKPMPWSRVAPLLLRAAPTVAPPMVIPSRPINAAGPVCRSTSLLCKPLPRLVDQHFSL
jgi:hypothetical protein